MRTRFSLITASVTVVLALGSSPATAQFAKGEDAIKYRQSAMALIGSHFGRMGPVAKKEVPYDAELIRQNVQILNVLADLPWAGFASAGSEGGDALDDVWLDPDGFDEKRDNFRAELLKLSNAADEGDFDAFRVAYGNTGKSCKACHDAYRKKR